jgi:hypothetical protein
LKGQLSRFKSAENNNDNVWRLYHLRKGLNMFMFMLLTVTSRRRQQGGSCCNSTFARSHLRNIMKNLFGWQSWSDLYVKCLQSSYKGSMFLSLLELLKQFRKIRICKCCSHSKRVPLFERQCIFSNQVIAPNCKNALKCAILSWKVWVRKRYYTMKILLINS